jgi:hypothetical protein
MNPRTVNSSCPPYTEPTVKIHEEEFRRRIPSSIIPERRANMWVLSTTANDTVSDAEDVATGGLRRPSTRSYIIKLADTYEAPCKMKREQRRLSSIK